MRSFKRDEETTDKQIDQQAFTSNNCKEYEREICTGRKSTHTHRSAKAAEEVGQRI